VVATRSVNSFSLPQTEARRHAMLAGAVLGVITVLVFGWLYIVIVSPVMRLQGEAERVAYGDLSKSVRVIRYDEIGLIGRALERVRIGLIRARVRSSPEKHNGSENGKAESQMRRTSRLP
jgi:methyl-accepting chemotaxis protein